MFKLLTINRTTPTEDNAADGTRVVLEAWALAQELTDDGGALGNQWVCRS